VKNSSGFISLKLANSEKGVGVRGVMMSTTAAVLSRNGRAIKLTSERWYHITESHDYMAGYFYDVLETIIDPTTS